MSLRILERIHMSSWRQTKHKKQTKKKKILKLAFEKIVIIWNFFKAEQLYYFNWLLRCKKHSFCKYSHVYVFLQQRRLLLKLNLYYTRPEEIV